MTGPARGEDGAAATAPRAAARFGPDRFDLTGAGKFEVPDPGVASTPFGLAERRSFTLSVDGSGKPIDCRAHKPDWVSDAFCMTAMAGGRFFVREGLTLGFERGTVNVTVVVTSAGAELPTAPFSFRIEDEIPLRNTAVFFLPASPAAGTTPIKSGDPRFSLGRMSYPFRAVREEIEATVIVLLTFNEKGRVATCRPQESTNTAWMAYQTCYELRRSASLKGPSGEPVDGRKLTWQGPISWSLSR